MSNKSARIRAINKPINLYFMLIGSTVGLSVIGLIMVFSASSIHSIEFKGNAFAIVLRQFMSLCLAIPLAIIASRLSLFHWKMIAKKGFLISIGLLALVQIPGVGKSVNGNKNWLSLGFIDVQPSEIAKFLMIIWAGYMLASRERAGIIQSNVLALIAPGFAICIILILKGSDLGTAAVFAAILTGLLFISGAPIRLFAFVTTVSFAGLAWLIVATDYRAARFMAVFDPFADDQYKNFGWQPAHSLLGLASGGLFGVGLGASRQKWGNLAEAHTDFIFSVIGEELGLFGTLFVLILLGILIYSIFRIALRAHDPFVRYVSSGIGCWIAIQTFLNIGSAISVLPVVGVTLPLISYGGSALIATYLGIGFVVGAARRDPVIFAEMKKLNQPWAK